MGKIQMELTKSQCESLACWIETELLPTIRRDEEITNFQWVEDMIHIYKKAKQGACSDIEKGQQLKRAIGLPCEECGV